MKFSRVAGTNEELRRMISEFEGKLKEREHSLQEVRQSPSVLCIVTYFRKSMKLYLQYGMIYLQ